MTNDTVTDGIWEIISNTEAIAVNQAWFGDSGECVHDCGGMSCEICEELSR